MSLSGPAAATLTDGVVLWFHEVLSQAAAEVLLERSRVGTFLTRYAGAEASSDLTLSVNIALDGGAAVLHLPIAHEATEGGESRFSTALPAGGVAEARTLRGLIALCVERGVCVHACPSRHVRERLRLRRESSGIPGSRGADEAVDAAAARWEDAALGSAGRGECDAAGARVLPCDVVAWGEGGPLGLGDAAPSYSPADLGVRISYGRGRVVCVAAGDAHSMLVTDLGCVLAFGSNSSGQLGIGARESHRASPCEVWGLMGHQCVGVAAGAAHSVVLTADGDVYTFGYNWYGALGLGDERTRMLPAPVPLATVPAPAAASRGAAPHSREASRRPVGSPAEPSGSRCKRPPEAVAVFIAAGGNSTYAVTAACTCLSWGNNSSGQLGLGDRKQRTRPTAINDLGQSGVVRVAAGGVHALFLTHGGAVYACGEGWDGRLGLAMLPLDGVAELPAHVAGLAHTCVAAVAAGDHSSAAVDTAGRVHMWGAPIGTGEARGAASHEPRLVPYAEPIARVEICGDAWVLALARSGAAWVHGRGCMGLGRADDTCAAPRQLRSLAGYHCVACAGGPSHVLLVTAEVDEGGYSGVAAAAAAERRRASVADITEPDLRPLVRQLSAAGEFVEPIAPSEATVLAAMALRRALVERAHTLKAAKPSTPPVPTAPASPQLPVVAAPLDVSAAPLRSPLVPMRTEIAGMTHADTFVAGVLAAPARPPPGFAPAAPPLNAEGPKNSNVTRAGDPAADVRAENDVEQAPTRCCGRRRRGPAPAAV